MPIPLHLADIYAVHSLLTTVLILGSRLYGSLVQMPMPVRHASSRKIPSNQPFPAGPFFAFVPHPTPTPAHTILLGFIFENTYFFFFKIKHCTSWAKWDLSLNSNPDVLEGSRPNETMGNWENRLERPTEL